MMPRDYLYYEPRPMLVDFAFDEKVAAVFPDMIRRSVPGYSELVTLIGLLAEEFAQPHTNCYDLGCSTGAVALAMCQRIKQPGCRIIAVDNAEPMVERCRQNLAGTELPVEIICADVRTLELEDASVAVLNFTLQFLPPAERLALLRRIQRALRPGGVLILSEKVATGQPEQAFQERMHLAFKRANGYSALEISQKRAALEKVLIPDNVNQHVERLCEAGFTAVHRWFQCFNFISLVAFK